MRFSSMARYASPPPWPWPGDSREEWAKRVALSYRSLIGDITEGRCGARPALHRLDAQWVTLGIHWTEPNPYPLEPADWLSGADLAHAIDRTRKDIYNWARLGHIEQRCGPDGAPEYSVASVIAYLQLRRARRTDGGK
ncbi:hypothetical protein GO011_09500 [Mycobacterium sp. 20091114027_K0903767]|nr:hypothetical protein [Mycobacterium sp. 20091114027_K0903767]